MDSPTPKTGPGAWLRRFHTDEGGVAMTEYIIVFTFVTIGTTLSLLGTTAAIRGYRDFLVWWMTHPGV